MSQCGGLESPRRAAGGHSAWPVIPARPRSQSIPLLRPWSRASAKRLHIPCISLASAQLLQGLSSWADLFFIVPEIHPEAFGTAHQAPAGHPAQTPSPYQPGSPGPGPRQLQSWAWGQAQQPGGEAQDPTYPQAGVPRAVLRTTEAGGGHVGQNSHSEVPPRGLNSVFPLLWCRSAGQQPSGQHLSPHSRASRLPGKCWPQESLPLFPTPNISPISQANGAHIPITRLHSRS